MINLQLVEKMMNAVGHALKNNMTVSILGDSKYSNIDASNVEEFKTAISNGRYNDVTSLNVDWDTDLAVPELMISVIGLAKALKEKAQWTEDFEGVEKTVECPHTCQYKGDLFACTSCDKQNDLIITDIRKDEVEMNNQSKEVKVENKNEGVVKMNKGFERFEGKINDEKMAAKVNMAVGNNPFFRIAVLHEGAAADVNVIPVDAMNIGFLLSAVKAHKWSVIWNKTVNYANFNYYIANDGVFTLETASFKLDQTKHIFVKSVKNIVNNAVESKKAEDKRDALRKEIAEDKKNKPADQVIVVPKVPRSFEEILKDMEAKAFADDMMERKLLREGLVTKKENPEELTNIHVSDFGMPNYKIDKAASAYTPDEKESAELIAKAPLSGLDTPEKLQVKLLGLISEVTGDKRLPEGYNKLVTELMMFVDFKEFCDSDGQDGISYKPVSQNWLFNRTGSHHYVIVYNVPNEDTLRTILNDGINMDILNGVWHEEINEKLQKVVKKPELHRAHIKYAFSSASKQRNEVYVFTDILDRESLRKSLVFYSDSFDFGNKTAVSKAESRVGTNLSNGLLLGGMAPYEKKAEFEANGMAQFVDYWYVLTRDITLADVKRANGLEVEEGDENIIPHDGQGAQTPRAAKRTIKKLGKKTALLSQVRAGKGTFQTLSKKDCIAMVKYLGLDVNVNDPIFFIPESMWKFGTKIDILPVVHLHASEEIVEHSKFCYQYLQTINLSTPEGKAVLIALAKETADILYIDEKTPAPVVMQKLGVLSKAVQNDMGENQDGESDDDLMEDKSLAASLFRLFVANPELAMRSAYLVAKVNDLFKKQIVDIARGRVFVQGCYHFMAMDPGVFTGSLYLKKGQVYAGGYVGKVSLHRSPNIAMGEAQVLEAVDIPELSMYKGLNVVFMNALDLAWTKMQGADFDGDRCFVCKDERIIKLVIDGIVVPEMPKQEAKKVILNWDSITEYYCSTFRFMHPENRKYAITTGRVVNLATTILAKAHARGLFLNEKVINEILEISKAVNDIIDAPKTGVPAQFGKYFTEDTFDNNDKAPNWLSKSKTVYPWLVETTETNEKARYYKDMTSPIGRLCNVTTPWILNRFTLKKQHAFKVNDLLRFANAEKYNEVYLQTKGYKSLYSNAAQEIAEKFGISSDEGRPLFAQLCDHINGRLRGLAAQYDMLTVAVACLSAGEEAGHISGFAYKCFEEGIIALFQAVEGKTYTKVRKGQEIPEGTEVVTVEGRQYMVGVRKATDVQVRKFSDAQVGKQVTVRVMGLSYELRKNVNTMNKLIEAIKKSNGLVHGGENSRGEFVMYAGAEDIGAVYTDRQFSVSADFVHGGYAKVKSVSFVRTKSELAMSEAAYKASLNYDAVIKYADVVVEYIDKQVDDKKSEKASSSQPSAIEFAAVDSSFELPSAFGVAATPLMQREVGASAPASNPSSLVGGLNEMYGIPSNEEKKSGSTVVSDMPDLDYANMNCAPEMDDEYYESMLRDMQ